MDHVAIMKKEWGLIPKVLSGEKTIESRWYKTRRTPWNKINPYDTIYFKDSGSKVSLKATATKVEQYEIISNEQALKIMQKHSKKDLGTIKIPNSVRKYITDKKYAIFIHFNNVQKVQPFEIDKKGYGMQAAWITTKTIRSLDTLKTI